MTRIKKADAYIGQQIKKARYYLAMSQSELGEKIGVTFQQIQKYESGVNRVAASRLIDVAKALGKPIMYFFPVKDETPVDRTNLVTVDRAVLNEVISKLTMMRRKRK